MAGHHIRDIYEVHHAQSVFRHQDTVAEVHSQEGVIRSHEGIHKHCGCRLICFSGFLKAVLSAQCVSTLHFIQRLHRLRRKAERVKNHHEKYVYINGPSHFHPTKI